MVEVIVKGGVVCDVEPENFTVMIEDLDSETREFFGDSGACVEIVVENGVAELVNAPLHAEVRIIDLD